MIDFGISYKKNGIILFIEDNGEEKSFFLSFNDLKNPKKLINDANRKVEFYKRYDIEFT